MKSDRTINILPLVLLLAIITTTVVVENIYAQSDEKQTAPSERVMINNELEQIPELFTYTKWEDNIWKHYVLNQIYLCYKHKLQKQFNILKKH